ncbi:MAG: hypothetical protein ABSF26_28065 [Thermoguttaceae bacterium]
MYRSGQTTVCSRRRFLSGCACCAGCVAGGTLLGSPLLGAEGQGGGNPKIRVVFCETSNDKPIWPNIGYDFDARRKQVLEALTQGCPGLELLPARVVDNAKQLEDVLKAGNAVDGYLVCVQGLGWGNDIFKLCTTGKPTLLVDNLFGGSGLFLLQQSRIMQSGKPIDWVSSSNDQDIVASARNFGLLQQGQSAAEVAAAFRATRHKNTPSTTDWTCKDDPIPAPRFDEALRQLRRTKILVVGGGWGGQAFSKAAEATVGVKLVPIAFEELAGAYAAADRDTAREFADRWIHTAEKVVEPGRDEIERSAAMYVGMKNLIDKHGARGISVNCLGGFYGGHLKAYPCLGFSQFNNDGLIGGCEGDQMSALTMTTMGALVGRPGYISDPVIDTSKNQIIYAHCVATTRPFGPHGPANPFRIRTHSEDRKGASVQSLLPAGYLVTSMEINPTLKQVILFQAKTAGNNPSDMACRTKLEALVKGDIEKLTEHWSMGWHRVTFYGDLREHVAELCARLKFRLIDEAS